MVHATDGSAPHCRRARLGRTDHAFKRRHLDGAASVWLVLAAVRTLGKNWSLAARVTTDHELIETGPYARVRHPIYTGMLGMLIADGLVFGHLVFPAGRAGHLLDRDGSADTTRRSAPAPNLRSGLR
ncbi:MAG: methyltransferase family protein [Chthoniobacterales bacterium]